MVVISYLTYTYNARLLSLLLLFNLLFFRIVYMLLNICIYPTIFILTLLTLLTLLLLVLISHLYHNPLADLTNTYLFPYTIFNTYLIYFYFYLYFYLLLLFLILLLILLLSLFPSFLSLSLLLLLILTVIVSP